MRFALFLNVFVALSLLGCATPKTFVASIGSAHGEAIYDQRKAVQADIEIEFYDPAFTLKGTMAYDTPLSRARLDLESGTTVVFDGQKAWITPANSAMKGMARFHVLTWPYFMAMPFKLDDEGAVVEWPKRDYPATTSVPRRTYKLSFEGGTGDAPDDWYLLFKDNQNRLDAAAYIVTYSKSQPEAERTPGIIAYRDWTIVDGVTFAKTWNFGHWSENQGLVSLKGIGRLSNIRFIHPSEEIFTRPSGSVEAPVP